MAKKLYTGDSLLDKLAAGPYIKNPDHNSKTKAGKFQPPVLLDTSVNTSDSIFDEATQKVRRSQFTNRSIGMTMEQIDKDREMNITPSAYNSEDDLNRARWANQSALEQTENFVMQAGVGEVLLGTMENIGNIFDGVANLITGDFYNVNPYTKFMQEAKENLKEKFKIYRRDPNASWDMGDWGWWMDNAVSVATTLSLLIPAAGWARLISMIPKLAKIGKLGSISRSITKGVTRGIAKATTRGGTVAGDLGTMRSIAAKAGRIERNINQGAGIVLQASLSRTGENFMEAKAVYEDIYENSKKNLENMPAKEFIKFLANNPEFKNMSKEDIAKEIARKSANKTFYNDYWMLLMDIPQFKAIGSIWGRHAQRASKASERIAAANQRKLLAGATEKDLIKNNFLTQTRESIRYGLRNPKDSFLALELGEGFEEMFQGIQSEKGMEVASKYFDPSITTRTLSSYLQDGSIWEQGFWGAVGGIVFNKAGRGLNNSKRKVQAFWNKKHMTAEDYERWKRSSYKASIEQLNGVTNRVKEFVSEMQQINDGINPYNFVKDKATNVAIIKDGQFVHETIDEEQKELLREHAIKKFVDGATFDSVDNGTIDLMKEIIGSKELDQFIANNGLQLTSTDKTLSQQIVKRMDEVSGLYYTALNDVYDLTEDSNPYVTINAARSIVRNKLQVQDYDAQLANIDTLIANANDTNTNFSAFEEKRLYDNIQERLRLLATQRTQYADKFKNKEISKSALKLHHQEIKKAEDALLQLAAKSTSFGAIEEIKKGVESLNYKTKSFIEKLNSFIDNYNQSNKNQENAAVNPSKTIEELINKKVKTSIYRAYTESKIPVSAQDYEDIYNEFGFSMDKVMRNKVEDAADKLKKYLINAENFDDALNNVMRENTSNKKLDEAIAFIKYGYFTEEMENPRLKGQIDADLAFSIAIEEAKKKRKEVDKLNEDAAEQGVELPVEEEEVKETNDDSSPSTGEETQGNPQEQLPFPQPIQNPVREEPQPQNAPTGPDVVTDNPADTNGSEEREVSSVQENADDNPIVDDSIPVYDNPLDTGLDEQELKEQAAIAEDYESESVKAYFDASKYAMHVGFTEIGRITSITDALEKGDNSKYNAFIEEIVNFLVDRGYSKKLAEITAKKAFSDSVNSLTAMNNKSVFGRLAKQLALGFNEESAKNKSISELINDEALDEIVEKFLNEYFKLVNNNTIINGRHIVNIESLFNFILENEEIDKRTAAYIYNNIGKFIAKHDGSKYIFTGFDPSFKYSAKEFFDRINENKKQVLAFMDNMHISPIEIEERDADYTKALIAAANGAPTFAKLEKSKEGNSTHIAIYVQLKKGKTTTPYKIGILRTVHTDANLSTFAPNSHYSGFANVLTIKKDGNVSLDCDFLFNALINEHTTDASAKELFDDLLKYYITIQDIRNKLAQRIISDKQAAIELSKAMPADVAKRILNNSLVKKLLNNGSYAFSDKVLKNGNEEMARKIARDISSILFYGHDFDTSDPTNRTTDTMSVDAVTMNERYNQWKQKIHSNYKHTYELQKGFSNENAQVDIKTNVAYHTTLNTISDPANYVNIEDAGFDVDKNSDTYTPLVIVTPEGHLVDEDGNDYGLAPINIGNYSMGFLVHNRNGIKYVAYFNTRQELKGGKMYKAVRQEIANLITKQLYNTIEDTHDNNFDDIINRLIELFNPYGVFRFNNGKSTILTNTDKTFATLAVKENNSNNGKRNYITFYSRNKNGSNSNAIGLYIPRLGRQVAINRIKDITLANGEKITEKEIRDSLNNAIAALMSSFMLNKSYNTMMNRTAGNGTSRYYRRENGKFIINLGGKDYVYENYGDFMLKNRAYNTNVDGSHGGFVKGILNENRVTINTSVADTSQNVSPENTFVSDLLFNDKNEKRKTVDTRQVLEAAGVPKDKIEVLLGTNSGMPIVTKRVKASPLDDGETNAYYDTESNVVYVTQRGAAAMNGDPTNALRLILHENLHRLFHNKRNLNDAQRERILRELREVYDYTRRQVELDRASGKITEKLYNSINSVLDKATVSNNEQTRMEEFLMESLTQPKLVEYLNNTNYHSEAIINGIPQRSKSIFQKIMDILLDLLGINTNRIKNNSILAREYLILSRTADNTTSDASATSANTAVNDNNSSPVERGHQEQSAPAPAAKKETTSEKLAKVRQEIDEVRKGFEKRITRSENFAEDHVYYIDGKPADTSVTQRLHGKQDIGAYGVPSSSLGNTADDAARVFFENHGRLPDDYKIPNVTEDDGENSRQALERDLNKIKDYLDKKFGKGQYGVITEEFPIGGVINVNGVDQTIAGTMDMLVYTANGDIYIYDFKTKRFGNSNAEFTESTLNTYKQQVNIYKQLIVANNPHFAERVKTGALIKFVVDYPAPSKEVEYRRHPTIPNQLQIKESKDGEFVNIQDSYVDYLAPFFFGDEEFERSHVIDVEQKDFVDDIKSLPIIDNSDDSNGNISGAELIQNPDEDLSDDDIYDDVSYDLDLDLEDRLFAATELISDKDTTKTDVEIYATPVANGSVDNSFGIKIVNDMHDYVNGFPMQFRNDIEHLLADDEINYSCQ